MRNIYFAAIVTAMAALTGCMHEEAGECPGEMKQPTMILNLSVDTGIQQNRETRANPKDFVGADKNTTFEKINQLRVIIVRGLDETYTEGIVEANRLVATTDEGYPMYDDLEFEVVAEENKRIYLIANESSLPAPAGFQTAAAFLNSFQVKEPIDLTLLSTWTASMPDLTPTTEFVTKGLFSPASNTSRLPLTEFFDIKVERGKAVDDICYANLFITRAAAKARFSFYIDDIKGDKEPYIGKGKYVTGIRLNGLDVTEYVFPKDTSYSPEKYKTVDGIEIPNEATNRYITSFTPVTDAEKFNFTFDIASNPVEIKSYDETNPNITVPARGPIYFPESMCAAGQNFTVQVRIGTKDENRWIYGENDGWITAKNNGKLEDNILNVNGRDAISRNTYLEIRIYFGEERSIEWQAVEVPYNSVILEPLFGI